MNSKEFQEFIEKQSWTNSKSYQEWAPHEYTLRNKIVGSDDEFEEAVRFIRANGFPAYFANKLMTYYPYKGRYYWTMGDPVEETVVLNRCVIADYKMIYNRKKK